MFRYMCLTCVIFIGITKYIFSFQIKSVAIIAKLSLNFQRSRRKVAY